MNVDNQGNVHSDPTLDETVQAIDDAIVAVNTMGDFAQKRPGNRTGVILLGLVDTGRGEVNRKFGSIIGAPENIVFNLMQAMATDPAIMELILQAIVRFDETKPWLTGPDGKLCDCPKCTAARNKKK